MNRIKLFAVTLVLCVTGVVYAAGNSDNQDGKSCNMAEAGASCCASGASCCDGGASCCKSGASCCAAHKKTAGEKNGQEKADATQKDDEGCCAAHMQ